MRSRQARERFPICFAYRGDHEFLSTEEAIAATAEDRIQSVWPFLVRRVRDFQSTLKSREVANFDTEDTLIELWVTLKEKNDEWSPERGKYITFVGILVDRELCAIRDKARTVHSPRNSSCRLKEYDSEEEGGTITSRRQKTANDIRRTSSGIQPIVAACGHRSEHGHATTNDPVNLLSRGESAQEKESALITAIRRTLSLDESTVIGKLWGLWGKEAQSVFTIAWESAREPSEVRRVKTRAVRKLRKYLTDIQHPAVFDQN